jgi:hypothetical protein
VVCTFTDDEDSPAYLEVSEAVARPVEDEQMCDAPIRPILTTRILHHQSSLTPPTLEFGHHPRETCSCSRLAMNSVFLANLALFCPSMKSLNLKAVWKDLGMVEPTGIEPATFSLRTRRSTN